MLFSIRKEGKITYFDLVKNGCSVATIRLEKNYLFALTVRTWARQQNLGTSLMREVLKVMKREGFKTARLHALSSNLSQEDIFKFYEKLGFKHQEKIEFIHTF